MNSLGQEKLVAVSAEQFGELIDIAMESYRYALSEELDGKRASEFLKAMGVLPTCGCTACARTHKLNASQ